MFILSQVQGASHLELTNLSFNYLGSQHVVSKHFDPHLHQTNLFSNLIPKCHLAHLPKKKKKNTPIPTIVPKKKKTSIRINFCIKLKVHHCKHISKFQSRGMTDNFRACQWNVRDSQGHVQKHSKDGSKDTRFMRSNDRGLI